MKFCDKLPKLRKNNNYSQEQLADKLNVSRQAVSKWEMGNSYPDMEKMLQMCKILNCNLEDLMDDGVIGETVSNPKSTKFNINTYMKDFLDFITKSYNMFCSMKFKEKVKFIFEMFCIFIVIFVLSLIMYSAIRTVLSNVLGYSAFGHFITNLITNIFGIVFAIIGLIIMLHLFKIRYLDYFITIEDQNVTEKIIEEPIEKKENKSYNEQQKEKIIIRDAKHSTFRFIDVLSKVILIMIKIFAIMCVIPVIILFIGLAIAAAVGLYHIQYGMLFLWAALVCLGIGMLSYVAIELVFNFIVSKKQHIKRIFITSIIALILTGASVGLGICEFLTYDKINQFSENDYKTEKMNIPVSDNTVFDYNNASEYIIDNTVTGINLEIKTLKYFDSNPNLIKSNRYDYEIVNLEYGYFTEYNFFVKYRLLIEDIKNKKIRYYDDNSVKITATMSQETKDKLEKNRKELNVKMDRTYYLPEMPNGIQLELLY